MHSGSYLIYLYYIFKLFNINEHIPISYAYYIKCAFDSKLDKFVLETGTNSGISFVNSLIKNLTK